MKKTLMFCLLTISIFGCGINKQAQQIKALEACTYKIKNVNQITLAGSDLGRLINQQDFNLASLPGVALGLLRKDIPLRANLNLEITNPSADLAAINQFEYKILVNNTDLAEGIVNQAVSIPQGQTVTVPVQMGSNIYGLISNGNVLNDIIKAAQKGSKSDEKLGLLTIKIKPTIMIGNTPVKYPGYITINKDISSKILL
ncbi:hypothetical protein [Pedobacter sp. Leaf194]|uniref:hypothetical protein n=1 Tax=Pedobacter sp. Leaf194 TaxID=1736297 RepID=UPI000703589E|nr:hypothetical protein [Pedobacter sp. Leaf194]KQS35981.1 hypothetical protein ASG14_11065 [Pedobacter sp. Leaf194]RYD79224.1 MAG: hypothetical protein EOP55_05275 [Sphingobacteriales bacterium]